MKLIRIISGTYGHRPENSNYVIPVTVGDPPISVDNDEAERLVAIGVAAYVDAVATAPAQPDEEQAISNSSNSTYGESGDSDPGEIAGHLDRDQLMEWKMADLKKLGEEMGIDVTLLKKKEALVDAICAVEVTAPAEAVMDGPALGIEDVVE